MILRRYLLLCCLGLAPWLVLGAPRPAAPTDRWTLAQALAYARAHHPQLAAAQARSQAEAHRAKTTGLLPNPIAEVAWMDRDDTIMGGTAYGVSQEIPFPGRLRQQRKAAEQRARAADASRRMTWLEIRAGVATAFFRLALIEQQLAATAQVAHLLQHYKGSSETRFATGSASFSDAVTAGMESSAARADLQGLQAERNAARIAFAAATGLPADHAASIQPPGQLTLLPESLDTLLARLSTAHPRVQKSAALLQAQRARVAEAKQEWIPDIMGRFAVNRRMENSVSGMLGVKVPLPGRVSHGIRAAQAQERGAALRLADTERMLDAELRAAYATMQAAHARARILGGEVVPRAQAAIRALESSYQTEQTPLRDVVAAIRTHRTQQVAYWQARTEYELARIEVEQLAAVEDDTP